MEKRGIEGGIEMDLLCSCINLIEFLALVAACYNRKLVFKLGGFKVGESSV